MPFLTRLVLVFVTLSCAAPEGAHACLYHDSLAYPSELVPLIRRAPPSPESTPPAHPPDSEPPPSPTMLQHRWQACQGRCSAMHHDLPNDSIFHIDCVQDCMENPKKYDLDKLLLAVQISHPDDMPGRDPALFAEHGASPDPHSTPAIASGLESSEQAAFEAWCEERLKIWGKKTLQYCLDNKRADWERERKCGGIPLPPDPKDYLKTVSPEFVYWCIECSVNGRGVQTQVASQYIQNPGLKAIWENEVKSQASVPNQADASSSEVGVDFAIWCMERCRSVERGVLKCVKGHLLNDHMLNEWKMTIPHQLFVKPKKNGAVRKKKTKKKAG